MAGTGSFLMSGKTGNMRPLPPAGRSRLMQPGMAVCGSFDYTMIGLAQIGKIERGSSCDEQACRTTIGCSAGG